MRGPWLVWVSSLLPLALWLAARPLDERVATWQGLVGTVSKALGLISLALLAWAVILAARLRIFERLFDGLDRAYRYHHVVGGTAFVLALLHPTLLAARYASVSMDRAARLWVPTVTDWPLTLGQVAVYVMIPALVVTLFVQLRHAAFIWTQRLLGILLIPAAAHVLTIRGDSRDFLPLRLYLFVLLATAVSAYVYHPLLSGVLARRHRYRVTSVRQFDEEITELVLSPVGRLITFAPGQFAFLRLLDAPVGAEPHPFSIASSPAEANIRFLIKRLGDYTGRLGEVQADGEATLEGPYGTFSYRHWANANQIWIAGGIGIAPFIGMARSLDAASRYHVDLWYGFADEDDALLAEVTELGSRRSDLRVVPVCEATDGLISADLIDRRSGLAGKEILLCGPHEMMEALRTQLIDRGVPAARMHYEDFAFR